MSDGAMKYEASAAERDAYDAGHQAAESELAGLREELRRVKRRCPVCEHEHPVHANDCMIFQRFCELDRERAVREKAEARLSWLESDEGVERAARVLGESFPMLPLSTSILARVVRDALLEGGER